MSLDCAGAVTLKCSRNLTVDSGEPVMVKAPSATLNIPDVALNGNLRIIGNLDVVGNIDATGTVMDVGGNSNNHSHP
jgi:phage baseplate assembly protein gpV